MKKIEILKLLALVIVIVTVFGAAIVLNLAACGINTATGSCLIAD